MFKQLRFLRFTLSEANFTLWYIRLVKNHSSHVVPTFNHFLDLHMEKKKVFFLAKLGLCVRGPLLQQLQPSQFNT